MCICVGVLHGRSCGATSDSHQSWLGLSVCVHACMSACVHVRMEIMQGNLWGPPGAPSIMDEVCVRAHSRAHGCHMGDCARQSVRPHQSWMRWEIKRSKWTIPYIKFQVKPII